MEKFNISKILDAYGLKQDEAAKILFPTVKYPKQAFDRILKGEASLSVEQMQRLAQHLGVFVNDLFSADTWRGTTEDGYLTFVKGDFKVKLNYGNTYLTLYKNGEVVEQQVTSAPNMTIDDFVNYINNLIKKYGNN